MAEVPDELRHAVYARDHHRCLYCGEYQVTIQHRRALGMGGSDAPLTAADLCCLCAIHNEQAETVKQTLFLVFGYKIPRSSPHASSAVPVYECYTGNWYMLHDDGSRTWVNDATARELMSIL